MISWPASKALVLADEVALLVADHRAGQQVALAEHLEAVADAQDGHALVGGIDDAAHHRAETGDRTAAQVVTVGEATGQHDRVDALEGVGRVPQRDGGRPGQLDGAQRIMVVQ